MFLNLYNYLNFVSISVVVGVNEPTYQKDGNLPPSYDLLTEKNCWKYDLSL